MIGGSGDNVIIGDANDNVLDGHAGQNTISGGGGNDTLIAGIGDEDDNDNVIIRTILNGDGGNDLLTSLGGDTQFNGGSGNDTLIASSGQDGFNGGSGSDWVDFTYSTSSSLVLDLLNGFAYFGVFDPTSLDNENLISIENAIGSRGDTLIIGNAAANNLDGVDGNDTLDGRGGNDILTGGDDDDRFIFATGYGQDTITDFDDLGLDKADASAAGLVTFANFNTLAGGDGVIDAGDSALGITVSDLGGDLVMDFGGGDTLTFVTQTELDADDFVLV